MSQTKEDLIFEAVERSDIPAVRTLLDAGIDVNLSKCRESLLYVATLYGNATIIGALLKQGAYPNWQFGGEGPTPLQRAVIRNHYSAVKTLLEYGANPHIKDYQGNTPITLAATKPEILAILQAPRTDFIDMNNLTLTHLSTVLTEQGVIILLETLAANPQVKAIDLKGINTITDASMAALTAFMRINRSLQAIIFNIYTVIHAVTQIKDQIFVLVNYCRVNKDMTDGVTSKNCQIIRDIDLERNEDVNYYTNMKLKEHHIAMESTLATLCASKLECFTKQKGYNGNTPIIDMSNLTLKYVSTELTEQEVITLSEILTANPRIDVIDLSSITTSTDEAIKALIAVMRINRNIKNIIFSDTLLSSYSASIGFINEYCNVNKDMANGMTSDECGIIDDNDAMKWGFFYYYKNMKLKERHIANELKLVPLQASKLAFFTKPKEQPVPHSTSSEDINSVPSCSLST